MDSKLRRVQNFDDVIIVYLVIYDASKARLEKISRLVKILGIPEYFLIG